MLVHCDHPSPRARYIVRHVCERMLGLTIEWVDRIDTIRDGDGPRLVYGSTAVEGAVHIPWSAALEQLPSADPVVEEQQGIPQLFLVEGRSDLFAAAFYLLSLADELRCTDRDEHGRVPSTSLFTVRKGLADRPVLDEWVRQLGAEVEQKWPGSVPARRYRHVLTVDMDNILRYAGRPFGRAVGASIKDALSGAFGAVVDRWRVRCGAQADPFLATLGTVERALPKVDRAILFLLTRGGGKHDHAADIGHPTFRKSMSALSGLVECGLHPSYASSGPGTLIQEDQGLLRSVFGDPVTVSRQHFLRWRLPATLRTLVDLGFTEDHSLGFSDRSGFRVGTCTAFPWYDLEREEETTLMLWPFATMDSALIEHQAGTQEEVTRSMQAAADAVKAVNGTFVSVWHDRYLSGHREFKGWPEVFDQVIEHART